MTQKFERYTKLFFWISGTITAMGALPAAISPISGTRSVFGFDYYSLSPQLLPIVGHWGIMVVGIGLMLFASATHKELRVATAIFSTLEKSYMVGIILYYVSLGAPFYTSYRFPLIADTLMALGGMLYLAGRYVVGCKHKID